MVQNGMRKLRAYQLKRPGLRIVDSFEAVMQLTNRISMLDPVRDWPHLDGN